MTTTPVTADPTSVATEVLRRLEDAWNDGDGAAFGAAYAADASFVTIRGEHIIGSEGIGRGHAGIFGTVYAGSVNRMRLVRAAQLAGDVLVAVSRNTLDCPTGPLAGRHVAVSTSVITRDAATRDWCVASTHNTLTEA